MGCTHKNNTLSYLVRWGSSAGKGIVFLFVCWGFLIAFLEKLVPEEVFSLQLFSLQKIVLLNGVATAFSGKAIIRDFVANKKTILLLAC